MEEQINDRPITPKEAMARRKDFIPSVIFEVFNTMICENLGNTITLNQDDIIDRIREKCPSLERQEIFDKHYLDVEPFYIEQGWRVDYDDGIFTFRA